jgi:hypothetical protein
MLLKIYTAVWNKYRPVILQLMIGSSNGPQEYKLSGHEFKALNAKEKGGYSFTLQVSNGKAVNNIRNSMVAQDLLEILQQSPKAAALTAGATYEISLDKQFVLHVNKMN